MARAKKEAENLTVNIKSMPIKAHAGASKYINDDWGTVAFFIPRNSLGLQFADIELQYNCIYFLVGFRDLEWLAYVGQAKKRNSGGSALRRLREHSDSTTEKYRSDWDWVIVVTNKDDAWGLDDLNALENAFYHEIPTKKNLNGNTPNSAGADFNSYLDKIKQIKAYIAILGFDIFEQTENIDKVQVTSVTNEYTIVEDLQNGMARIPEIVTPQRVVKDMVDMLEKENPDIWSPDKTFLDPACKGGEYLYEIYTRLMESETMKAKFPSDIARAVHILQNQVYGIALSQVSLDRTVNKLNGFGQNIKIIPNYISILKSKDLGTKADGKAITFKDKISEVFGKDMKFDVVIGNPPYQESTGGGNGGGANTLYDKFVIRGVELTNRYISFITPARWYTDESRVKNLRDVLTNTHNMKELNDFPNTEEVFEGVYIMGGVCFYLYDKLWNDVCKVVEHRDNKTIKSYRYLKEDFSDIFIRNNTAVGIVKKVVTSEDFEMVYNYIQDYNVFRLRSFEKGGIIPTKDDDAILYYTGNKSKGGGQGYISRDDIPSGRQFIDTHKIFINSVSDNMLGFPYKTLYKAFYGAPGTVCTESYLMIGPINDAKYAENIIKYLSTKFVRILVQQRKTSQLAYKRVYKFVPLQDFTSNSDIDWSKSIAEIDQQLYKKYGLSAEEIDYIEKTIKPME